MAANSDGREAFLPYSRLRNSTEPVSALLSSLLPVRPDSLAQAVLICDPADAFDPRPCFPSGCFLRFSPEQGKEMYLLHMPKDGAEEITERLRENAGLFGRVSLSQTHPLSVSIQAIFAEAENNLLDSFVYPEAAFFPYRAPNYPLLDSREDMFTDLFRQKNYQQLQAVIQDMPDFFRENGLGVRDAVYMWNRIGLRSRVSVDPPPLEHLELYELIGRFSSIREMSDFLGARCLVFMQEKRSSASSQFALLVDYIDRHFSEKLTLGELCDLFFISPSYASSLFQKEKGMSFSQYVTKLRMEKACSLMQTYPHLSIAEIGEMTGYRDYFYFAKIFHRQMGCTPSAYRNAVRAGRKA